MIADVRNLKYLGSSLQEFKNANEKSEMYKTTWYNEEDGTTIDLYVPVSSDIWKSISVLKFGQMPKTLRLNFKRRSGEKGWFASVAYIAIE